MIITPVAHLREIWGFQTKWQIKHFPIDVKTYFFEETEKIPRKKSSGIT